MFIFIFLLKTEGYPIQITQKNRLILLLLIILFFFGSISAVNDQMFSSSVFVVSSPHITHTWYHSLEKQIFLIICVFFCSLFVKKKYWLRFLPVAQLVYQKLPPPSSFVELFEETWIYFSLWWLSSLVSS